MLIKYLVFWKRIYLALNQAINFYFRFKIEGGESILVKALKKSKIFYFIQLKGPSPNRSLHNVCTHFVENSMLILNICLFKKLTYWKGE